jgi:ATP-dependent helicase Lhr and Lhr-like helicase
MHYLGILDMNQLMRWMPDSWSAFFHKRGPRPIQLTAMPLILKGESVFITAPTASGKTEAAIAPLYQRHISFNRDHLAVVYVAPTKALVNDIYFRLTDYLGAGRESSGVCRYTGDHHDFKEPDGAFILVTTPEALDSLQLTKPQKLEHIRAIVIDEVHFLHGKARGEQLRYVIGRIRSKSVEPKHERDTFQIVAMSATLNDMEGVGRLWAGDAVQLVSAADPREIEMDFLQIPDGKLSERAEEIAAIVKEFIETAKLDKVLIFANTRNDAHHLSVALDEVFKGTRWPVHLHFGILEAKVRDEIEADLKTNRYGICVSTSTLELGVDIGDIQTILLLSPPLTVSSFLQRIGRGNRRSDTCKVVSLVRNDNERMLYQALYELARTGNLEPVHEYTRPSVGFQQILSHAWQGLRTDKPLTERNLTIRSGGNDFSDLLKDMLSEGHLRLNQGALIPSDKLIEQGDRRTIHSVIAGDGAKPVFDSVTGDAVAAIGAGAGEGVYFLGGQLRSIASADHGSYVLERVSGTGEKRIGKIPAARGGRGMSRTLAWKIAELTGSDPSTWYWSKGRLVTWGGWDNNLLLTYLMPKHGLGTPTGFDGFGIDGLTELDGISPEGLADIVSNHGVDLKLKQAEKFRESSRYYSYLSTAMKTQEALGAVPMPEFTQWLEVCVAGPPRVEEAEGEADTPAEGVVPRESVQKTAKPAVPEREIILAQLELHLHWEGDGQLAERTYAGALSSLFFGNSGKVAIGVDANPEQGDLDLKACIDLFKTSVHVRVSFFWSADDSTEFAAIETTGSEIVVTIPAEWHLDALLTPHRNLHWFQSDIDYLSPLPVLSLPGDTHLHPAAFHGLVALAKSVGELTTAELQQEGMRLACWFTSRPEGRCNPVVPVVGDHLWLAADVTVDDAVPLWLQLSSEPGEKYLDLRESLSPLFADGSLPDLSVVSSLLREALPQLTFEIASLATVLHPPLLTTPMVGTVLILAPSKLAVTIGVDLSQPPDLLLDAVLHGVGHLLLGHLRPGDEFGHVDTSESIRVHGTPRRWDREVKNAFSAWFIRPKTTVDDCTPEEKAMLGLWRMIGEMLGESRRLHPRAEAYQRAAYQRQAAQRLLAQLEEYRGAMLCDGVGLGKTYVATTVMVHYANAWRERFQDRPDELLADPFRITILAPNSVVSTWQREALPSLAAFGLPLATIRVISHTRLSRITKTSAILEPPSANELSDMAHLLLSDLVIVDEAHNFRSLNARRSVVLRDLLRLQPRREQRRRVLLLTATPINNTLDDLMQESALLFSKPLWLSNAVTDEGYRQQAIREVFRRCQKPASARTTGKDIAPLLIHGGIDEKFSAANDFRDDLDFGPNVQRIGDYLKEQSTKLQHLQQDIRDDARNGNHQRPAVEPIRIAEELLDRIVVQRSRALCKEIERQQGSDVELLFRPDAGLPEKLHYHDEYDGTHDILAGFLPLFDRGEDGGSGGQRPLSLKVYMWYDVREGLKSPDEVSSVVGLQRILVLKRLESSPVSFLITLLRLTALYAYRLQSLIELCAKLGDQKRTSELNIEVEEIISAHNASDLAKVTSLATADVPDREKLGVLKRLARAHQAKLPAAEADDAPLQLQLFEAEDEESLVAREQLDRLWGLKEHLVQDFSTLLNVAPGLANVIFGKFDRSEWPHRFIQGGNGVDWPTSAAWGLRIISDAKLRSLFSRLLLARRQGQKVIVFSQFSDTLAYAHSVLRATCALTSAEWRLIVRSLDLKDVKAEEISALVDETAVITGGTEDRDDVVNAFAPYYRIGPFPPATEGTTDSERQQLLDNWTAAWRNVLQRPIHVLFSSDVLAEGVNLQDAATLINFDVHWNPVRMIQRSGRIDRRLNPRIEKSRTFPELEEVARQSGSSVPSYYWHGRDKEAPLTVNLILPDELEAELLLRERIALKTLAIDFTLGLEQGTGAEADWMADYAYQGVSSLNAFQKDRAIEQVAGYHEKFSRIFKDRGILPEWATGLNTWFCADGANLESPIVGRASLGRRGESFDRFERFSRYLEPYLKEGIPYWCWAEKTPGDSVFDGWLIMDGVQWPPPAPTRDIPFHPQAASPVKAAHLLAAAYQLESGLALRALVPSEFVKQWQQGATALAAPKLGSSEDRLLIGFTDVFVLQLPEFDPEKLGQRIS